MENEEGLKDEGLKLDSLEDPGSKYELKEIIGQGIYANVHAGVDKETGGKVAIKIQEVRKETKEDVEEEYRILRDLSSHPNLPDFYGAYRRKTGNRDEVWFVMELCEGGPVTDVVRGLINQNKKMSETHIAFILKETLKALVFLHKNHVIHRDVKGSNILLTKNGEVKLVDFGLSRELSSTLGRRHTNLGTPYYMAPEVVITDAEYDNRADVWALGMTAIELGDGKNPYQDMHPTRVLFQIVRNPPPTLYRPANWTQTYNDFIAECLVKNPEHRPYMTELVEHPFFTELPENDFHLNSELKSLLESVTEDIIAQRKPENKIAGGLLKKDQESEAVEMQVEDLAALESINEDTIFKDLETRYNNQQYYTFIGDVLVFLNPNQKLDIYGYQFASKYKFKSRSDNEPHIFSVADSAYQDMMHHEVAQNVIVTGETMSGKTTQFKHLLKHLIFLGMRTASDAVSGRKIGDKVQKALEVIHAIGNAATPLNPDSTRHILNLQLTFSKSGRTSGAIFWLYQIEKWRVTGNRCPQHANFHIFYYLYDGLAAEGELEKYNLEADKNYRYLRREIEEGDRDPKTPPGPRENPEENVEKFKRLKTVLTDLEFNEEEREFVWKTLAAILLLGEVEFTAQEDGNADIKDSSIVDKIAELLTVDGKKLSWALCNYCVIENDTAARRRHSRPEAIEAKNVLARALYTRLVDWLVNIINHKLSINRAVYGDSNCVNLLDMFGFECYPNNGLEQLFVNIFNEQLQYYYNQKVFIAEMEEEQEEEVPVQKFQFYDNKGAMDELMNKPSGVLYLLDEANKMHRDADYMIEMLKSKPEGSRVRKGKEFEFTVAHYTGKVSYDASLMVHKNRDFLPPELTEVMRASKDPIVKSIFFNKLSRTGNVTLKVEPLTAPPVGKKWWGAALLADNNKTRRYNTASKGEFSQTKGIRTAAGIFRAVSLEVLRGLAGGSGSSAHFVRCLRADLGSGAVQPAIVRHQLRALAVVDTAKARRSGFSHRISFEEFIKRYKFLAFDFDENVDETKDNCRLLLVRLKLEGYHMGKTKVFLKYYNEEYLSRLYETQVKKIVKVQCMLRTFLAKRNFANKQKKKLSASNSLTANYDRPEMSQDRAAVIITKHMKGYAVRKKYGPLINTTSGKLDLETAEFIRLYFKRWKAKTIFQVLLHYRSARLQDLVYFSQQVHLFSQNIIASLTEVNKQIDVYTVKRVIDPIAFIGEAPAPVRKMPFRLTEQLTPFYDSSPLCGTFRNNYVREIVKEEMTWDSPFNTLNKGCQTKVNEVVYPYSPMKRNAYGNFIDTPYCRDANSVESYYRSQRLIVNAEKKDYQKPRVVKHKRSPPVVNAGNHNRGEFLDNSYYPQENYFKSLDKVKFKPRGERSNNNDFDDKAPTTIDFRRNLRPVGQVNPVKEMEMKAKKISRDTENNEEPPFNFQAMLRKTNYQRDSLRRGREDWDSENNNMSNGGSFERPPSRAEQREEDIYPPSSPPLAPLPVLGAKKKKNSVKPLLRKDSLESIKLMVAAAKDFGRPSTPPPQSMADSNHNSYSEEISTELVPGLIVVGQITDL